jgi:monoamine oxidase
MHSHDVIVVGAGLAGLVAARQLRAAGLECALFEAADRVGGRVQTMTDIFGAGLTTELGAEFIDSSHAAMLDLCAEFGLPLIDTAQSSEAELRCGYYFAGHHRSEDEVLTAYAPLVTRMRADLARLYPYADGDAEPAVLRELDHLSIDDYLDRIGAQGWIRDLLAVAYTTENGLDTGAQSSLNLLEVIGLDPDDGFRIFGSSDQRYKINGGNERLVQALAATLGDAVHTGHRLLDLRAAGPRFELTFALADGSTAAATGDFIVLALPFAALRRVALPQTWPALTLSAIRELGYGTNEKLIVGIDQPVWRTAGFSGDGYSDLPFQTGWDSSRLQENARTSYTFYLGGATGARLAQADLASVARDYVAQAEAMYPGMGRNYNERRLASAWSTNPLHGGSYSSFRPGQTERFADQAFAPVGRVHFAGEHCSREFQGFMNGAVETGLRCADKIIAALSH